MSDFNNLPFETVMKLYRQKLSGEKKGDQVALTKLEAQYPDLFSPDFEDFIFKLQLSIEDIRQRHGIDFRKMIEPEELILH